MKLSKKLAAGIAALAIAALLTACDDNSSNISGHSQNTQAGHAAELTDTVSTAEDLGGCC